MSIIDQRILRKLTRRLIAGTRENQIHWESLNGSATEFIFEGPASSLEIKSKDRDGIGPFIVIFYNSTGTVIDEFVSHGDPWASDPNLDTELTELYNVVRRQVLDVEGLLEDLMSSLPPDPDEPPF